MPIPLAQLVQDPEWLLEQHPWLSIVVVLAVLVIVRVVMKLVLNRLSRAFSSASSSGPFLAAKTSTQYTPTIVKGCRFPYGVVELQGRREYMEDRHLVLPDANGHKGVTLYGVFDGHGGDAAAEFCIKNMAKHLKSAKGSLVEDTGSVLEEAFKTIDSTFLATWDAKFCGTTAIAMVANNDVLTVANTGDSRAIVVKRDGSSVPLSRDHKPNHEEERKRILAKGGAVVHWGVWRVEGVLAVSRAIGDGRLKDYVIPDPDVKELTRGGEHSFAVIATDGLWDVMNNDEVGYFLATCEDPQRGAELLVCEAFQRGTADNVTVLVVDLRDATAKDSSKQSSRGSTQELPQEEVSTKKDQ